MIDRTILTYHVNKIVAKSAIYVMAILLCLPCTIKQEIKQVLDVPVSQLEQFVKPGKTAICQSVTVDQVRTVFESNAEDDSKQFTDVSSLTSRPQTNDKLSHEAYPSRDKPFTSPIPIFVLHERYLI